MVKRILVTTDFSENSKAGLHFAIQLASQNNYELVFFHTPHILIPNAWNNNRIEVYEESEIKRFEDKLDLFVKEVYDSLHITPLKMDCVVKNSVFPQSNIMEYAVENNFSFICISTRGAGKVARLLGTNTGNLINHSDVPVIAVPYNYTMTPVKSILLASDLVHIKKEIAEAVAFAEPLGAKIELLHLTAVNEQTANLTAIEAAVKEESSYPVHFNFINRDPNTSLVTDIETVVENMKPSIMIMFTEQNRGWFEKIFLSSKSAEYSFNAKVPLLVFKKT
ncbi:MAG: universal stress protein [Ferruginibacter sp.]